jgi:hypothetical protein
MRSMLVGTTLLALTAGPVGVATPLAAHAAPRAATVRTAYAFQTSGYGTRVIGGVVPAGSSTTSYQVIGCTNVAGKTARNYEAQLDVPGLGRLSGVTTTVATRSVRGVVSSTSRHDIAQVVLAETPMGTLTLNAVHSLARAFHSSSGFHSTTTTDIGSIVLTAPDGSTRTFPAPAPGRSITIPGVATLSSGDGVTTRTGSSAYARTDALVVDVVSTGSRVKVGHTIAQLSGGIRSGIFGGFSAGSRVSALQAMLRSGYTPLQKMPCQGTKGNLQGKDIAHLDLGGQLVVDGLSTRQRSSQTNRVAQGYEEGRIASVDLGDGRLIARGIVGRATVTRRGTTLTRSTSGSTIGSVVVNGEKQTFPDTGVIEVPGVLKLERNVTTRLDTGVAVVALRVTVLDQDAENAGAVINLGTARMQIRKAR